MSQQLTPLWSTLARHLRTTEAVRDLALLAAIGALASFAILFTSRVAFDDVVHELSLTYASSAVGADSTPSDLRLMRNDSAVMAPASSSGALHGGRAIDLTVMSFDAQAPVSTWLSGTLLEGSVCSNGVMVDQATAGYFGVGVGDELTMWWPDLAGRASGLVRVCGVLNVWHPGSALGNRGYAVASKAYLVGTIPAVGGAPADEVVSYWFHAHPPGSTSKAAAVRGILTDQAGWSTAVLITALIGSALWAFAVARVWSGLRTALDLPWRVLGQLGARPMLLAGFIGSFTMALAAIGGVVSAGVARASILGWTDLYVSSRQIALVVVGLLLIAFVTVLVMARRPALSRAILRRRATTGASR